MKGGGCMKRIKWLTKNLLSINCPHSFGGGGNRYYNWTLSSSHLKLRKVHSTSGFICGSPRSPSPLKHFSTSDAKIWTNHWFNSWSPLKFTTCSLGRQAPPYWATPTPLPTPVCEECGGLNQTNGDCGTFVFDRPPWADVSIVQIQGLTTPSLALCACVWISHIEP